jgi:hypothetical protein
MSGKNAELEETYKKAYDAWLAHEATCAVCQDGESTVDCEDGVRIFDAAFPEEPFVPEIDEPGEPLRWRAESLLGSAVRRADGRSLGVFVLGLPDCTVLAIEAIDASSMQRVFEHHSHKTLNEAPLPLGEAMELATSYADAWLAYSAPGAPECECAEIEATGVPRAVAD